MKYIGRILVRTGNIVGLFFPMNDGLKPGLYNIKECLDEMLIEYAGPQAEGQQRVDNLDFEDLLNSRPYTVMTKEECEKFCGTKDRAVPQ